MNAKKHVAQQSGSRLALDQSKLLGFRVLGVKVKSDEKNKFSIVGAKIGKIGKYG